MSAIGTIARRRAEQRREQVAARIARALPGARIEQDGERIMVSGRGLIARFVAADDLRNWPEEER